MQHHAMVDALLRQQGARAEAIMWEHANATLGSARLFGAANGAVADGLKILQ
jgi:GntR family transcriptional regulator, vanillate catabolism transcriptional regulator